MAASSEADRPRHIVVAPSWIGDCAMAAPFLAALRAAAPGGRIEVLANEWVFDLLDGFPWVDVVHLLEKRGRGRWKRYFSLRAALGGGRAEAVWLLPNSFRAALVGRWIGARRLIGYSTDGRGWLLKSALAPPPASPPPHLIDYYLGLLEAEGLDAKTRTVRLPITPEAQRFGESLLSRVLPAREGPLVGLNPGAFFGESKTWPPEKFSALSEILSREDGAQIVVLGGPGERELAGHICRASKAPVVNLAGEDTLATLPGLLAQLDVLVSGDTGPLHVAALVGTPTVAMFGPTDYRRTAPRGPRHIVVRREMDCSPCFERTCPLGHHNCMAEITSEEVAEKVRHLMKQNPASEAVKDEGPSLARGGSAE